MDLGALIDDGVGFLQDNPIAGVGILLAAAAFVYWQPKLVLKLLGAALVLGALIYVATFLWELTSEGMDVTRQIKSTPSTATD